MLPINFRYIGHYFVTTIFVVFRRKENVDKSKVFLSEIDVTRITAEKCNVFLLRSRI